MTNQEKLKIVKIEENIEALSAKIRVLEKQILALKTKKQAKEEK